MRGTIINTSLPNRPEIWVTKIRAFNTEVFENRANVEAAKTDRKLGRAHTEVQTWFAHSTMPELREAQTIGLRWLLLLWIQLKSAPLSDIVYRDLLDLCQMTCISLFLLFMRSVYFILGI